MSDKLFIFAITGIIAYATYKRYDCFQLFVDGVKEGLQLFIPLFSSMMALFFFVRFLGETGIIEKLTLLPVFSFLPPELLSIALLRPFSSSGSLLFLDQIYHTYGLSHLYSHIATLLQSASDTTFYIASLYFSSLNIKKTEKAIALSLFLDVISVILAFIFAIIFF